MKRIAAEDTLRFHEHQQVWTWDTEGRLKGPFALDGCCKDDFALSDTMAQCAFGRHPIGKCPGRNGH